MVPNAARIHAMNELDGIGIIKLRSSPYHKPALVLVRDSRQTIRPLVKEREIRGNARHVKAFRVFL